jgi:hypothetical protein
VGDTGWNERAPPPPPWPANTPLPNGTATYRPIDRPDIAMPDPTAKRDVLFNNTQF